MPTETIDKTFTAERRRLADVTLSMIESGPFGDPLPFDSAALEMFAFQYANNQPYRDYCDAKGVTPETVTHWSGIPPFPTQAFKTQIVTSFPVEEAVLPLLTSGTTSLNQRGRIYRDEIGKSLVFAANRMIMKSLLFPDFETGRRCRLLILAPSPEMAPSMGMAIGMEQTRVHFGTPDSRFLIDMKGLDVKGLVKALTEAENSGVPVAMIGSTTAYVYFFNACKKKSLSFTLPKGSRIADGGGYRGRFGEATRGDYYRLAEEILGVPANHCVNILGMAESGTNFCDNVLRDAFTGQKSEYRRKVVPPWARVVAVSVKDLSPLPPGEIGLLRHFDLTNLPTTIGIQTDNLGYTDEFGGFEILGRAKVVDGKLTLTPSERPVGPMGDKRIFRLLEAYVNFTIGFKMGMITGKENSAPVATVESMPHDTDPSCPASIDDMVANPDSDVTLSSRSSVNTCNALIEEMVGIQGDGSALCEAGAVDTCNAIIEDIVAAAGQPELSLPAVGAVQTCNAAIENLVAEAGEVATCNAIIENLVADNSEVETCNAIIENLVADNSEVETCNAIIENLVADNGEVETCNVIIENLVASQGNPELALSAAGAVETCNAIIEEMVASTNDGGTSPVAK